MEQVKLKKVSKYEAGKLYKCIKYNRFDTRALRTIGTTYRALPDTTSSCLKYIDDKGNKEICDYFYERWMLVCEDINTNNYKIY